MASVLPIRIIFFLAVPLYLNAMYQRGVDAIGKMHRMSDGQRDDCLLPFGQRSFGEDRTVVVEEFVGQFMRILADFTDCAKVLRVKIGLHCISSLDQF
ncbi:MAG: hypothetical protein R6V76_08850 [Desulfobacterales bacterium]